jgi:phage terminase large subunit
VTVQDSDRVREWSLREWINAQPRQQIYLDYFVPRDYRQAKKFPFYGGAAGGGKSYIGRKALAKFCIQAHALYGVRNCRVGLFCEDYPSLKDRQISKIREEFPSWMGELKDHRDLGEVFLFNEKFGNNFIALRNLDKPSKYDSVEFAALYVDELTKNKVEVFDELRKRLRWPTKVAEGGTFPNDFIHPFGAGANPGGVGHGFCKQYWVDHDIPRYLQKFADHFVFVPAKAHDNVYNPASYFDDLMSLPDELRRAYAEGDWTIFAGQFFGEWRQAYHVCKPFEIPRYWKRGIAFDWGWAKPNCILFFAISPDGDVYVYKEFYGTHRLPEFWAKCILDQADEDGIAIVDYIRVIDPATQQKDPRFGRPVREMLDDAGVHFEYANNDRLSGWTQVRSFLAWERDEADDTLDLIKLIKKPKLYVLEGTAPALVRTLPVLVADKNRVEDVDTDTEDHAADTLRYFLMTRPAPTKIPFRALSHEWQEAMNRAKRREKEKAA